MSRLLQKLIHILSSLFLFYFARYNLIDIMVNRSYYVYLRAPAGYLLSGGVCNDKVPGWKCTYSAASVFAKGYHDKNNNNRKSRFLLRGSSFWGGKGSRPDLQGRLLSGANAIPTGQVANANANAAKNTKPSVDELELGISEGRSSRCVAVDRGGMPDSRLDIGLMRLGDVHFEDTNVELKLDLIQPEIEVRGRTLMEVIQEKLMERHGVRDLQSNFYVLDREDEEAIGIVTSEVSFVTC